MLEVLTAADVEALPCEPMTDEPTVEAALEGREVDGRAVGIVESPILCAPVMGAEERADEGAEDAVNEATEEATEEAPDRGAEEYMDEEPATEDEISIDAGDVEAIVRALVGALS